MRTTGLVLVLCLAACGGGKGANEPTGGDGDGDGDGDGEGDYMVPEEKMDEINTYFTRKQSSRQITDCWVATMEKDEVKEGQKGKVTFNFTIGTDGKVGNIKASSLTPPNAKTFESCIAEKMKSWTVTTLEQPFDTSWTFSAGEL